MKTLAYVAMILSIFAFALGVLTHVGLGAVGRIFNLTPEGFLNGVSILLLFSISFALLELSNKK